MVQRKSYLTIAGVALAILSATFVIGHAFGTSAVAASRAGEVTEVVRAVNAGDAKR